MRYDVLQPDIYMQARELGLHYVELMLLKQFGYDGSYWNRAKQVVESVPWAPTSAVNP